VLRRYRSFSNSFASTTCHLVCAMEVWIQDRLSVLETHML
jgi:hypothetical protein